VVRPPYAVVVRLCLIAADNWPLIDGEHPSVDLMRLPPYRFFNVVWAWSLGKVQPEDREEWIRSMNAPLDPKAPPTPEQEEQEGADFLAAMSALGAG